MAYDSWNINDKINGIQILAILALYPMQNKCITTNYIMFIDTNILRPWHFQYLLNWQTQWSKIFNSNGNQISKYNYNRQNSHDVVIIWHWSWF